MFYNIFLQYLFKLSFKHIVSKSIWCLKLSVRKLRHFLTIRVSMSKLGYPCGYWCRAAPFRCKFPAGTQSSHHGAAPRGPDWEINTILWKCVGEHTFIPQYLDCTYLHLHHGPCLHEMVKVMQTLTFSHLRRWYFHVDWVADKSLMLKTFNLCVFIPDPLSISISCSCANVLWITGQSTHAFWLRKQPNKS